MRETELTFDRNAHFNIEYYNITHKDGIDSVMDIQIGNLFFGDLTAVKLIAKAYNVFGDVILFNGNEEFEIVIQDFIIKKNQSKLIRDVILPNNQISELELIEKQACFLNGDILLYRGEDIFNYTIKQYDEKSQKDNEKLKILKSYTKYAICQPETINSTDWICACGCYNNKKKCSKCGVSKENILYFEKEENFDKAIEKYKGEIATQEAIKKAREEAKRKSNISKILIAICCVVAILAIVIPTAIMGERKTFGTESLMQASLQGTYTYYDEDGDAMRQVVISGNTMKYIYKYSGHNSLLDSDIEWHPSSGTFETFEKWIVLSDGSIKNDGDIFKKGGYMSTSGLSSSYESGNIVLKISNVAITHNSNYTVCTGTVKNTGNNTYKFVEVKGAFKNKYGTVIDTDWTYAVGSEGLEPGESTSFYMSVSKDYDIYSCTVTILDYDN